MKKLSLLFLFAFNFLAASAQDNCAASHRIFRIPAGKTPQVVTKLGTAPQFHPLRNLRTAEDMHTKMVALGTNPKYSKEINSLFMSMGYSGVNDPSFAVDDIGRSGIPFGAQGMLGDGSNNYVYSIIVVPGKQTVEGWSVRSANGHCSLYFMSACGNAFYYTNEMRPEPPRRPEPPIARNCPSSTKLRVKVYARHEKEESCGWCGDCEDANAVNIITEETLITEADIEDIPVAENSTYYPEKRIYVDVNKKTFKKIKAMNEKDEDEEEYDDSYASE